MAKQAAMQKKTLNAPDEVRTFDTGPRKRPDGWLNVCLNI